MDLWSIQTFEKLTEWSTLANRVLEKNQVSQEERKDDPGERTLFAQEDGEIEGLLFLTLSREDLTALNNSNVTTALIRGNSGNVAIALEVKKVLTQTWEAEADLYLELAEDVQGFSITVKNTR